MIGGRDMAFPKLNMFSYWAMPFAMVAILYSFYVEGGSPEAGWTSYPVLSVAHWSTPGSLNGQTWWLVALLFAGISSLMGSINYITTDHHAPRSGHEDVPDADDGLGLVHHGDPCRRSRCRS